MDWQLNAKSLKNMEGDRLHDDLRRVIMLAASMCHQPFEVFEARRTMARQKALVKSGFSRTYDSRHLTGHAADLVPLIGGKLTWDKAACLVIADVMKEAARELGIAMRWGGDWDRDGDHLDERFFDGPHFELERAVYPAHTDPRVVAGGQAVTLPGGRAEAWANQTLIVGDVGEDVEDLHKLLDFLGWPVSGRRFTEHTQRAVIAFQKTAQLKPDGVVGPKTQKRLAADAKRKRERNA